MSQARISDNGVQIVFDDIPGGLTGEQQLEAYIAARVTNNPNTILSLAEMGKEDALSLALRNDIRLEFRTRIQNATLTLGQAVDIFTRINNVSVALGTYNDLRGARMMCNNTATGGAFTQTVKDLLLAKIDAAISQL